MPNLKQKIHSSTKNLAIFSFTSLSILLSGCVINQNVKTDVKKITNVISSQNNHSKTGSPDITPDKINVDIHVEQHHDIVWDEMRKKFHLADQYQGQYDNYLEFYKKRKTHLKKVSQRAEPYLYHIVTEVKQRSMPYEIALLPIIESGFRPRAHSSQKAVGLWQFIPSTGDIYDLKRNWWYDGRKDVVKSTQAALDYLERLYKLNNNDWLLALASYNAGLGTIYRAQKQYRKKHKNDANIKDYQPNYWEIRRYLPKETQNYVPKLLAVSHLVDDASQFNIELQPIKNSPFFTQVALNRQVSLSQVAKLADTPKSLLDILNPAYHQPATPPNGPFHLLLPTEKADAFSISLKNNKEIFNIHWQKHKIMPGDSLGVIAQKYKTSSKAIKKLNGMKNSKIRAGKTLLIPIPADKATLVALQTNKSNAVTSKKAASKGKLSQSSKRNQHTHTVKAGDSLWNIAKHYNVTLTELSKWNNISVKTPLKQGQKLAIFNDQYGQKIKHTLQTGESLWSLSQKYKVTSKQIARWNSISLKKTLQPGMVLTIWANSAATKYIVKSGDNLWNIAKANQVSAKQLAKHNNLSLKSLLKPGQILQIPLES